MPVRCSLGGLPRCVPVAGVRVCGGGGIDLVCSLLLGWVLGGAFGVILVPPSYLLLKFLAALRLSCVREVEGSGRGAASAVRLL